MHVDTWWIILYFRTLPVKNQALRIFISAGESFSISGVKPQRTLLLDK
jgi:hypothetical protein